MTRLKILHIITKGSPFGGAQKYVYELATHLPADQFESVVLVGNGEELPERLKNEKRNKENGGKIRVIRIPELARDINIVSEFKVFWQLIKIIRREKPNIVHLNSSKIGGLGALAVRLIRISYLVTRNSSPVPQAIFTAHGWAFNEPRHFLSVWTIGFLSWVTALLSDRVIVIAKNDMIQIVQMPFVKKKIRMVHNGIEPIEFKSKDIARKELADFISDPLFNIPDSTLWIGTVAELHKNKNIISSISAIAKSDDNTILVVIGEGEERANLEKQIRDGNLVNRVFLMGKVENAAAYLKAFDVFALPSVKEGLPYTLLEAGLAGLPCLSTYVGGIPEIIRNNYSGILVEPTVEEIAAGLHTLVSDSNKRKEFGKNLKEKVERDFSLEKMIEGTVRVYRQ